MTNQIALLRHHAGIEPYAGKWSHRTIGDRALLRRKLIASADGTAGDNTVFVLTDAGKKVLESYCDDKYCAVHHPENFI